MKLARRLVLIAVWFAAAACGFAGETNTAVRPANWAQKVEVYRIVVCGWTKPEAIAEMKNGGFDFNPAWHDLVSFIEKADIADIKRCAGLAGK